MELEPDHHSLSAILLNEDYYTLIRTHHDNRDGLEVANATSLIPLKAFAWLDLTRRKAEGESIDSKKIKKHRNDVFLLAATLPGEPGPELPPSVTADLARFLQSFPTDSPDWAAIIAALKSNPVTRGLPLILIHKSNRNVGISNRRHPYLHWIGIFAKTC